MDGLQPETVCWKRHILSSECERFRARAGFSPRDGASAHCEYRVSMACTQTRYPTNGSHGVDTNSGAIFMPQVAGVSGTWPLALRFRRHRTGIYEMGFLNEGGRNVLSHSLACARDLVSQTRILAPELRSQNSQRRMRTL